MKTYRIGVFEEQGGYINVKAKSKKIAEKKAREYVEEYGISDTDNGLSGEYVETTHRDVYLV